jgi:hypothetical protein
MQDQAKKEAELILRDAALERDRKMTDVRSDLETAERNLFRLRTEYDMTLSRMRSALSSFSTFLSSLSGEREAKPPDASNGLAAEAPGLAATSMSEGSPWRL